MDVVNGCIGGALEFGQRKDLIRRHNIQQMVRHGRAFSRTDLISADVKSPVDLPAIRRHDLAVEIAGKLQRDRRLSHGGGTN